MFLEAITRILAPGVLALGLLGLAPALAQSTDEIQALKEEIETLKQGQSDIQKSLEDIKAILEPLRRRTQAQKFEPKDVDLAGAAVKGSAEAPVTLVEFTDYQCPFCRRHFQTTMPQILKDYVEPGRLRYVLKEFPIPSLHPEAPRAAEGALCAGEQNNYWGMHDLIFQNPKAIAPDQLKDKAAELGLDVAAFSDCLDSGRLKDQVRDDIRAGRELGVRGTPSFFLGRTDPENPDKITATKLIRGAQNYAAFKKVIDELLTSESVEVEKGS